MKFNRFYLIISCITLFVLILQSGCEEQAARQEQLDPDWFNQPVWQQIRSSAAKPTAPTPEKNIVQNTIAPKIQFEKMSHDFGNIRPGSKDNVCEFVFTNTGNANLIISEIKSSCDCTLFMLEDDKKEYAPGESGKVIAGYTDTQLGQAIKHIYVSSNDPMNPRAELAIKAELTAPIDYEPKTLNLSLISNNSVSPSIVVKSLDNQPFSITGFQSLGNAITAKFNPNEKATQFVLETQIDMAKLRKSPEGTFNIQLSHPDCKIVSGTYYSPPRFSASPQKIIINQADPSKTIVKTINIISNYNEDFSVEPLLSNRGIVNIRETKRIRNGYQVTVEINPPVADKNTTKFSDSIKLTLPGMGEFVIPCNGYYPGAIVPESENDGECKTCGPVRIDNPGLSYNPRRIENLNSN